jgi:hypothetical protein
MKFIVHPDYQSQKESIFHHIQNFETEGLLFGNGDRNVIKLFQLGTETSNIKSFKIPNLINKVVYHYFRKSKAERSYSYALQLLQKGVGTPHPIAFAEEFAMLGMLNKSYYVSEHLITELTFRELVEIPDYPDGENILRQFTQFCFELHEKGIEFLDHSPGNTLIKNVGNGRYAFFLVDLNRMKFHNESMSFETRIANMRRLTHVTDMILIMSDEYAKLYNKEYETVKQALLASVSNFHRKLQRKRKIKKYLKFWK